MFAHAICQIEPPAVGIHILWLGPPGWMFARDGWTIERRLHVRSRADSFCSGFDAAGLAQLRSERESRLPFGVVTLADGRWLIPIAVRTREPASTCEVATLELDEPRTFVQVQVTAGAAFAMALRDGRVVETAGPSKGGPATFTFEGQAVDTVRVHIRKPASMSFCISKAKDEGKRAWAGATRVVEGLNLPIRELLPGISDEYAEAKSRLLNGEELDLAGFESATEVLRGLVAGCGPPRPGDMTLLSRAQPEDVVHETAALDPLQLLTLDPTLRRVFGFGWFDRDPALQEGSRYDYRVTGRFPVEDLSDRIYGFHTLPSQTALPAEFFLGDLRVRLAQPGRVERDGELAGDALVGVCRRGLRLGSRDQSWWRVASLDEWSIVLDFPLPVSAVILELAEGHELTWTAGAAAGIFVDETPVAPGLRPRLEFPVPVNHIRLRGKGFLYSIRIPSGRSGSVPVSAVVYGVLFKNSPRPSAPVTAGAASLQKAETSAAPDGVAHRHELGISLGWRPAVRGALDLWPAATDVAPPLDASTFEVEHRRVKVNTDGTVTQTGPWLAVLDGSNRMFGSRDTDVPERRTHPGVDFERRFPDGRRRVAAGLDMSWTDVFDPAAGGSEVRSGGPRPGSHHQYRIWAVDAIGRRSDAACETAVARLEKHVPPPVPVGPVRARVLARGAPELTAADLAMLGDSDNVIVLEWQWLEEQRRQDPYGFEFRVYATDGPLDRVNGEVSSVVETGDGIYDVAIQLSRPVEADAARGLALNAGYPFRVISNTAGTGIVATVRALVPDTAGRLPVPATGRVSFPLRTSSKLTQPASWTERVAVVPISNQTDYTLLLRDRLSLSPEHPRDAIWVGVSAADREPYISDSLPDGGRPGNESAIVALLAEARYLGRPAFEPLVALAPVAEFVAPEPAREGSLVLDLLPHLDWSGLGAGDLVRPERVAADSIYAAYEATEDNGVIARSVGQSGDSPEGVEVLLPTTAARDAVVSALRAGTCRALENVHLVFLAASHPGRDRLFEAVVADPVPLGPFEHAALPAPGRYVYRVRRADAAGGLSPDGAVARVVVRAPSPMAPAAPERLKPEAGDGDAFVRLGVPSGHDAVVVVVFSLTAAAKPPVVELVRIANRPDLPPADRVRLRTSDGSLLAPTLVAPNDDGDLLVELVGDPGKKTRVWACCLSPDAVASAMAGPWTFRVPFAPLAAPALSITADGVMRVFAWTTTTAEPVTVVLEHSADSVPWTRISPPIDPRTTTHRHRPPSGVWQYRLRATSPDGRIAHSNVVA